MSNVSDRHNIEVFESGKSKPLSGQVLVKVGSRETAKMKKDGIKAKPAICASVPAITDDEILSAIDQFLPAVRDSIMEARKQILANLRDAGETAVTTEQMSLASVVQWIQEQQSLTAELIKGWFDSHAEEFTAFVFDTNKWDANDPTEEQVAKAEQVRATWVKAVSEDYAKLKGAYMSEKKRSNLQRFLGYIMEPDSGYRMLQARIAADVKADESAENALGM